MREGTCRGARLLAAVGAIAVGLAANLSTGAGSARAATAPLDYWEQDAGTGQLAAG